MMEKFPLITLLSGNVAVTYKHKRTQKMIVEVVMYGIDDEPIAKALVDAPSLNAAHEIGLRLIRKQYPDIDPQKYNQTMANEIYFRSSTD